MAEGQDRTQGSGGVGQGDSLQKEISRREAFERKNAELEGVNDELRVENGELRTQVQMLRKKLEEMAAKPKSASGISMASNTPELQKKHHKSKQSSKKQSSTPVHGADNESHEEEVHTLRREKKELKDELEETKAKQLNFEAAFKTEFDLRTTMEEKYDNLRERYERLVIENDELRRVLRQHNILIPPPPSLRAKLRITADGPMKPPRRNKKRSASLQPGTRPKSESAAVMMDNFYSHEYLPQGEHPSYRANSLSPRQMSASPSDHGEFLFTELTTIEGSCEIASNPFEDKEIKEDNHGKDLSIGADKRDQSNGQPLQPNKTPTGDIRTVQSRSIKNKTQQESPGHHHQHSSSGGPPHAMSNSVNASPAKGGASELTGQPETFKSQESVGVTITVSSETDIMTQESIKDTGLNSNQLVKNLQTNSKEEAKSGQSQESGQPNEINEEDRHHHIEQMSSDGSTKVFVPNEELEEKNSNKPENMEWELDNLMATSAQQLESAKAFYAEMHAHLKKKENSDNDSDD